ncbi:MAG: hypothetical protein KGL95_04110, partial [Patescibacteria group bacterium]|nr:hypothetical protein [Patescibacteria group bacterium]
MKLSVVVLALGIILSVLLFLLVVQYMQIPGILVMGAVALSNGVSQLLIQRKKRVVWAFSGLLGSI